MKARSLLFALVFLLAMTCLSAAADTLELPLDTQIIQDEAFLNCTSLTGSLVIPNGVQTIGVSAFAGCSGFTGVPSIPDSVQSIGAYAFAGCSGLSGTLYIGASVDVASTAFDGCPNLTVIRGDAPVMHVAIIADGSLYGDDINADCREAVEAFCTAGGYQCTEIEAQEGEASQAVDQAVAAGSNVIVMPGFSLTDALFEGADLYPDVKFIGIDTEADDLPDNVYTVTYKEEQAGFMAGYAAVRLGYRHLGFLGGMEIPSVNNYGYGFVQGADAAAGELGVTDDVIVEYDYAGSFGPSNEIQAHMQKWYDAMGVEVVFACGGGIWGSIGGATMETGKGKLIGVDIDQAAMMDGIFGAGKTVTSAMKNTGVSVETALSAIEAGDWASLGGCADRLGVVSADPAMNHVGLPASTQFGTGFTQNDYAALVAGLYGGSYTAGTSLSGTDITVRTSDPMCVAVITDEAGVEDQGFNQAVYEGADSWCGTFDLPLRAYAINEDMDGIDAVEQAASAGFDVFVMPGFGFAETIAQAQDEYPDAKFIGIDISADDLDGNVAGNTFLATYREEQAGFMAGYAAVKRGYRHLGFIGGVDIPSVMRYGYGFVQGADAAAKEMNIMDDVTVEFSYADAFWPSPELTNRMRIWYTQGVEVIFACGGGIWGSVGEAADMVNGAMVIGVDIDQAYAIGTDKTLTSAMKGLGATVLYALEAIDNGSWPQIGGTEQHLGVVSNTPEENFVQLAPSTHFGSGFTRQNYASLVHAINAGTYTISDSTDAMPDTAIRVNEFAAVENGVAIVTGSITQSDEERGAALALQDEYNIEAVQLATYPENFYEEMDETTRIIADFGSDPIVKAIIVCQAVPGTADGFAQVKADRDDVYCLAGEPQDSLDDIGPYADVIVTTDQVARGYSIIKTASDLGCDTFVHLSFPRHLEISGIALRLRVMRQAGIDLGVTVEEVTVKDPVGQEGYQAAVDYISQIMPGLIQTYGQDTAFFCTNDGLIEELIRQLVQNGGYFIEADMPSPLLGYPEALGLQGLDDIDYHDALTVVENTLVSAGCADRFGTWAYPYTRTLVYGLTKHAMDVLDGNDTIANVDDVCDALSASTPGASWNGKADGNIIEVFQDTYIMGNPGHYAGNAGNEIPAKYYDID